GPTAIAGRSVASVENTTSPSCSSDRTATLGATAQYGRKRPWSLEHRTEQSPLCWAFQRLLQIARSSNPCRNALARNLSNRRVRTRMHGGVGGAEPRGSPLFRSVANKRPRRVRRALRRL